MSTDENNLAIEEHNKMLEEIDGLIKRIEVFKNAKAKEAIDGLVVAIKRINELYMLQFDNKANST